MNQVKQYFLVRDWPVLSIDTKKKELLGRFERAGQAWTDDRLPAWDHDFPSSSWGKVIPYGVYDLAANEALVYLAKAQARASWPVTQFAAGGTDWASGATMRRVRSCCWPIAAAAMAIACRCFGSSCTN